MASSVPASLPAIERAETPKRRPGMPTRFLALMPLWVMVVVGLAAPAFFPPMTVEHRNLFEIDLAAILDGIALLWMLCGLAIVWRARSEVIGSLALTIFTVPATVAVVFAPAAALVMQN